MEFDVVVLQIDDRIECVQVDYEPTAAELSSTFAGGDADPTSESHAPSTEKFLLLAEGPYTIKVTSHCNTPVIVRIELDGQVGKGNFRLNAQSTILIRTVQFQSGMHPTRLAYRKSKSSGKVKEVRDRVADGDNNVTIHTIDDSAVLEERGGYASHVDLLVDTVLLRVLFHPVHEVYGMWRLGSCDPLAVMALHCGAASRLALHFGIPVPPNELLHREIQHEKARQRQRELELERLREEAAAADLEPLRHRKLRREQHRDQKPKAMKHKEVSDAAHVAVPSDSGVLRQPPERVLGFEEPQHALRPRDTKRVGCSRCAEFAQEKERLLSQIVSWKHEAEVWKGKYNDVVTKLNRDRLAARTGRRSVLDPPVSRRDAVYDDGGRPFEDPAEARTQRHSQQPSSRHIPPHTVSENRRPRKQHMPVRVERPTHTSASAPRVDGRVFKASPDAIEAWTKADAHQWRRPESPAIRDHYSQRRVLIEDSERFAETDRRHLDGARFRHTVHEKVNRGSPHDESATPTEDDENDSVDQLTSSTDYSDSFDAPSKPQPAGNGHSSAPNHAAPLLASPPSSVVTSCVTASQVIQNKRIMSSLDDGHGDVSASRWARSERPVAGSRTMAHVDYFSVDLDNDVEMPPNLSPLGGECKPADPKNIDLDRSHHCFI